MKTTTLVSNRGVVAGGGQNLRGGNSRPYQTDGSKVPVLKRARAESPVGAGAGSWAGGPPRVTSGGASGGADRSVNLTSAKVARYDPGTSDPGGASDDESHSPINSTGDEPSSAPGASIGSMNLAIAPTPAPGESQLAAANIGSSGSRPAPGHGHGPNLAGNGASAANGSTSKRAAQHQGQQQRSTTSPQRQKMNRGGPLQQENINANGTSASSSTASTSILASLSEQSIADAQIARLPPVSPEESAAKESLSVVQKKQDALRKQLKSLDSSEQELKKKINFFEKDREEKFKKELARVEAFKKKLFEEQRLKERRNRGTLAKWERLRDLEDIETKFFRQDTTCIAIQNGGCVFCYESAPINITTGLSETLRKKLAPYAANLQLGGGGGQRKDDAVAGAGGREDAGGSSSVSGQHQLRIVKKHERNQLPDNSSTSGASSAVKITRKNGVQTGRRPVFVAAGSQDRCFIEYDDGTLFCQGPESLQKIVRRFNARALANLQENAVLTPAASSSKATALLKGGATMGPPAAGAPPAAASSTGAQTSAANPNPSSHTVRDLRTTQAQQQTKITCVAFGKSYETFVALFSDGAFEVGGSDLPKQLKEKLFHQSQSSAKNGGNGSGVKWVSLGPSGEWFLEFADNELWWGDVREHLIEQFSDYKASKVRRIYFGDNGAYCVRYQPFINQ